MYQASAAFDAEIKKNHTPISKVDLRMDHTVVASTTKNLYMMPGAEVNVDRNAAVRRTFTATFINTAKPLPEGYTRVDAGAKAIGRYLQQDKILTGYAATPNVFISGDIDIVARVAPDSWSDGNYNSLFSNRDPVGSRLGWEIYRQTGTRRLAFSRSADGVGWIFQVGPSADVTFADGTPGWIRVTHNVSTNLVTFYQAADQAAVPSTWTQLGTPVSVAAGTPYNSPAPITTQGGFPWGGKFYRGIVRTGIDGPALVDVDFTGQSVDGNTTGNLLVDTRGNSWTSFSGASWVLDFNVVPSDPLNPDIIPFRNPFRTFQRPLNTLIQGINPPWFAGGSNSNSRDWFNPWAMFEFKPYRGVRYADGTEEYVPLGSFYLTKVDIVAVQDGVTGVRIVAEDMSAYVAMNPLDYPYSVVEGETYQFAIQDILEACIYQQGPVIDPWILNAQLTPFINYPAYTDAWNDIILKLAEAMGAEAYFGLDGEFVLNPILNPQTQPVVRTFNEGADGARISPPSRSIDKRGMRNGVIVKSSAPWLLYPVEGNWFDTDMMSIVYIYAIGQYPEVIEDATVTNVDDADHAAEAKFYKIAGIVEDLELTVMPDPRLDVGDVIWITSADTGANSRYVLDTLKIPLSIDGTMTGTTRRRFL